MKQQEKLGEDYPAFLLPATVGHNIEQGVDGVVGELSISFATMREDGTMVMIYFSFKMRRQL